MRKLLLASLMAAMLTPVMATAEVSRGERRELQRDRQDIREQRRDVREAYRSGDPRAVRDERGDLRDARREFREDRRDADRDNYGHDDWRRYREQDRNLYRGGNWRSDYRYQAFRPGVRIGVGYYAPRYVISDPWRYRLPRPGFNQRWVRHYNDVILVDTRRGFVIDVIRGFYF